MNSMSLLPDDEWRPSCNKCGDSDDVNAPLGDYYWCFNCEHAIDDDGDCVTSPCSTCDDDDSDSGDLPTCNKCGDSDDVRFIPPPMFGDDGDRGVHYCHYCNVSVTQQADDYDDSDSGDLLIYGKEINDAGDLAEALSWVSTQGFIPSISSGPHAVGTTLEKVLGHDLDALPLRDWSDTEMKAQREKSQSSTTLFTKEPSWEDGWNAKRLLIENGYADDKGHEHALRINLYTHEFHGLHLESEGEEMHLIQSDTGEVVGSWDTDSMEYGFEKIKDITYITADSQTIDGVEHFHYNTFQRFRLKDNLQASDILSEIENGALDLELRMYLCADHEHCRAYGRSEGQVRNHGTGFRCAPRNLHHIFDITDLTEGD